MPKNFFKLPGLLLSVAIVFFTANIFSTSVYSATDLSCGIGDAHYLGTGFQSYNTTHGYTDDNNIAWAAVEPTEGNLNTTQFDKDIALAQSKGKKIFLMVSSSERNPDIRDSLPSWLLDQGVQTFKDTCGESSTEMVAVWDPLFVEKFTSLLNRLGDKYNGNPSIDGVIMMGGGYWGESLIGSKCAGYETGCTPDVLNPSCPAVQSMANVFSYTASQIASYSDCNMHPCPGGTQCGTIKYGSACYMFDDIFIASIEKLITIYVDAFPDEPIIFQVGPGMSGTGRTWKEIATWANTNYGSRVMLKWNGLGAVDPYFDNFENLSSYGTVAGYEVGHQDWFSKTKFRAAGGTPGSADASARTAIYNTVKKVVDDNGSCYLTLQDVFYSSPATSVTVNRPDLGGEVTVLSNEYYFNPNDNTENCANSEISNWCPGYLNAVLAGATLSAMPPAEKVSVDMPGFSDTVDEDLLGGPSLTPGSTCTNPAPDADVCYVWNGPPPALGCYLQCVIPKIWKVIRVVLVAIAIALTMLLIFKSVTSVGKPKALEELPARWKYLLIFVLIVIGGGSALNIILRFLGFGGVAPWITVFNHFLNTLNPSGGWW